MDPPPVQYVTTKDGKSIAYAVRGEGTPFVFMPALFNHVQLAWRLYPSWLEGLASRFRLVTYDARGQGMSSRGLDADHSMEHWQYDLEAVVEAESLHRFVLMGGCHAGHLAARYAFAHPGRVEALILNTVSLSMTAWPLSLWRDLSQENWELFLRNFVPQGLSEEEAPRYLSDLREMITQSEMKSSILAVEASTIEDVVSSLRIPTLILQPRLRRMIGPEEATDLAARIPGSRLVLIDGEFIYGDGGQGVAAIEEFLRDLSTRDRTAPATRVALSSREVGVLRLLAAGKSNQQIADDLVISRNTVLRHVNHIFDKTGATNRVEATSYAHRNHIV